MRNAGSEIHSPHYLQDVVVDSRHLLQLGPCLLHVGDDFVAFCAAISSISSGTATHCGQYEFSPLLFVEKKCSLRRIKVGSPHRSHHWFKC